MSDIIGLSGKLGSGKDFIAREYFKSHGYHRFSLADHFKISLIGRGDATYDEVFKTKPPHIRDLLQKEGTERGRMVFGEDVWVFTMQAWMELLEDTWGINKFIVPDCRFKNEVLAIQKGGGRVIRIIAPLREEAAHPSEEARNHISETDLDDFPLESYDGLLFNDPVYKDTINAQVNHFLGLPPNFTLETDEHNEDLPFRKVEDLVTDSVTNITNRLGVMLKHLKAPLKKLI